MAPRYSQSGFLLRPLVPKTNVCLFTVPLSGQASQLNTVVFPLFLSAIRACMGGQRSELFLNVDREMSNTGVPRPRDPYLWGGQA